MAVTNTGIVLRTITGVHDANFVRPLGDEEVLNGGFDTDTDWNKQASWGIANGEAEYDGTSNGHYIRQISILTIGAEYIVNLDIKNNSGKFRISVDSGTSSFNNYTTGNGAYSFKFVATSEDFYFRASMGFSSDTLSIDNVSVKEVLVNRESTATNTGIVERAITGLNESELWLDAESTSVVNNTGIVERPITGVNESDPMFPDNTISNIVNIAGLIGSLLADLEARATTFENREGTQNILINLQKC